MNNRYQVESSWTTDAGLPAVVTMNSSGNRCGYVGVLETSKLFGVGYHQPVALITQEVANNATVGNKSPMILLTACCGGDTEDSIRRSLDIVIDVHGGLTYSSDCPSTTDKEKSYPITTDRPTHWFGYDCAHYGDDPRVQDLEYCKQQCESLAIQLKELS
jgi:hypothetical protein